MALSVPSRLSARRLRGASQGSAGCACQIKERSLWRAGRALEIRQYGDNSHRPGLSTWRRPLLGRHGDDPPPDRTAFRAGICLFQTYRFPLLGCTAARLGPSALSRVGNFTPEKVVDAFNLADRF
ncbi:hypothetical protein CesoFtcFv8_020393 [Champsocephalus esox]|uniref:Uncharacterized protein n=1 Tax=Champsocephalus esox TaxID=159716 RepID=A0AAN8BGM1_9TELE|nr:hypothetical protein CesoFtcFv8_020393 [Champsocephalus esox]